MNILIAGIIGDELIALRIIIDKLLPNVKYYEAYTTRNILKNFLKAPPNLIMLCTFSDFFNWTEIVEIIRVIDPDIPVVLVSNDEHLAIKAFKYGVFDYLIRPISKEDISRILLKMKITVISN